MVFYFIYGYRLDHCRCQKWAFEFELWYIVISTAGIKASTLSDLRILVRNIMAIPSYMVLHKNPVSALTPLQADSECGKN